MTAPTPDEIARRAREKVDIDQFIFSWFNELYPDEMARCLAAYEEHCRARAPDA